MTASPRRFTLGFVGLGRMGGTMAARFLAGGHRVHGTSRTRENVRGLEAQGLLWHDTPRQVAAAADVLFTSVPDDGALRAIAYGGDGILAGTSDQTIWVDTSTVSPDASREVAEQVRTRGGSLLDAPVSGGVSQVRSATLTIMAGGDRDAYLRVEPLLRELGKPVHVGSSGQGLVLKLAIDLSLCARTLALAEGLVLAERAGLVRELASLLQVLRPSSGHMDAAAATSGV